VLRNAKLPGLSLVVSNVRGPDVPLYMAGARLLKYEPISIVVDGTGLNLTSFSYAGNMSICAISCRDMLPDPAFFADCMRTAFQQMKEAAAREAAFSETAAASAAVTTRPARGNGALGKKGRPAARKPSQRTARVRIVKAPPVAKRARAAEKALATATVRRQRSARTVAQPKS
jgi:diacylglycerol O-acyltransferase